jgi:hypothetical protein
MNFLPAHAEKRLTMELKDPLMPQADSLEWFQSRQQIKDMTCRGVMADCSEQSVAKNEKINYSSEAGRMQTQ